MKMKLWIGFGLLSLVVTACAPPGRAPTSAGSAPPPGPVQAWIDAPLPDSTVPLLPYRLVFHGASPVSVDGFEVRINGVVVASVPPTSSGSEASPDGTLFIGEYSWAPPAPGTYLIAVRAEGDGQFSPPDQIRVTVAGDEAETPTPEPPPPPSPTATVEEVEECTYAPSVDLNCRLGPGTDYGVVEVLSPDQSVPIVGRSADGLYWYVLGPNRGQECTVPSDPQYGEASGDCGDLPMPTPVPLPTPTPTPPPTDEPTATPTATWTPTATPTPTITRRA